MALSRFEAADDVRALARELGIRRELFYRWRAKVAAGGEGALQLPGRPRPTEEPPPEPAAGEERIAELERKIGRQQIELDFFRAALQQVRGQRRRSGGPGDPASTR
jgi:transposase